MPALRKPNRSLHRLAPAIVAACMAGPAAFAARIDNQAVWRDVAGEEILAQGGCILQDGALFHWIGPAFEPGNFHFHALNHYTSPDLQAWTRQAPVLSPATPGLSAIPITATSWVGRPWVLKRGPGDYVMWLEAGKLPGSAYRNRFAVFHAPALAGPWAFGTVYESLPDGTGKPYALGDLGAWHDASTGSAYLLYTFDKGEENGYQAIVRLSADFRRVLAPAESGVVAEFPKTTYYGQEAAALFKRGATYYHIMSDTRGWRPSVTRYRTADRIGPASVWSPLKELPMQPAGDAYSFRTQHDFVLEVKGTEATTFVYCGDRWSLYDERDYDGAVGRQAWFPLTFDAQGAPTLNAPGFPDNGGDWTLDVMTGRWNAGVTVLAPPGRRDKPRLAFAAGQAAPFHYVLGEAAYVVASLVGGDGRSLGVLERGYRTAGLHALAVPGRKGDADLRGTRPVWIRLQADGEKIFRRIP